MKKRIYLLLLAVSAIFISCRDDSGEFVEQLFTNIEITGALRECIKITVDSTANTLAIVDTVDHKLGYFNYADSAYRLALPAAAKIVADTLIKYGYKGRIDTLIFNMNRAAEKSGNEIVRFWDPVIKAMVFPNPNQLLHGRVTPIIDYVKETRQTEFVSALVSSIYREQLDALQVITEWNQLQQIYIEITGTFSPVDILIPVAQQMANGFFTHMAIVEDAVRKDPKLRGNGLLYEVFATLKP
jgi:hypothetical protein